MRDKEQIPTPPTPLPPPLSGGKDGERDLSGGKGKAVFSSSSPEKGRVGGVGKPRGVSKGFLPYNKTLTALARANRRNPTKAKSRMWNEVLRMRMLSDYKFLRQKPLGGYIVDFYCSELRLVIEIDVDSHAGAVEYDMARTEALNSLGLTVVRYTNQDVMNNIDVIAADLIRRIRR